MSQQEYERFVAKFMPEPMSGCWLWTAAALAAGYGQFRDKLAHRYSYEVHRGPIPDGLCVLHRCDTPACVNPDHLFLGTHKDNAWDKVVKGRAKGNAGTANHLSKLDDRKAAWIREGAQYGLTPTLIADLFGVAPTTIKKILDDITWRPK